MNMKDNHHKNFCKAPEDSSTDVNFGLGVWGNRRKVVGVRVDEKLYEAFKPIARRVFGSVCRPIEAFMLSVITMNETHVNFGNTIRIERLTVERNLRPRRRLTVDRELLGSRDRCGLCGRSGEGFWLVEFASGLVAFVCEGCLGEKRGKGLVKKVLARGEEG